MLSLAISKIKAKTVHETFGDKMVTNNEVQSLMFCKQLQCNEWLLMTSEFFIVENSMGLSPPIMMHKILPSITLTKSWNTPMRKFIILLLFRNCPSIKLEKPGISTRNIPIGLAIKIFWPIKFSWELDRYKFLAL